MLRKILKLVVDLLNVGHAPQSESVNPMNLRLESVLKNNPKEGAFFYVS